jgi:hypothetical protein
VKRGGGRSVREEDRHHRQVLVTVGLKLALFHRVANPNGAVTRTRKCVDTTSKLALYQDCNTLVTRIEIRIMRLRKDKGVRIKGALQATQDPNVPKIIPVLYLV